MTRTRSSVHLRSDGSAPRKAAIGSIGLPLASWITSRRSENLEGADRWGIFAGEWAPTFFAPGLAPAN
ncbi:hypothetical protein [Streptomyces griseus]|uniref:hypothetical protein n=1 Tax=Streptomyces griseus TaxID=1911 RepID=UPI00099B87E0